MRGRLPSILLLTALLALSVGARTSLAQDSWSVQETEARRQEMISRYRSLLERRPVEGTVLSRLLDEVGGGRAFERLIAEYEQLASDEPDRFAYHMILGHLYKRAERFDDAIAAYGRAAELEPSNALPARALADALYRAGRVDEAKTAYERALELTESDEDREAILFALADIAFDAAALDEAVGYLGRIVEMSPRDVYMRMQLADLLREHGRFEDALAQYQAILELSSRDTHRRAVTLGMMGDVLVELARTEEAVGAYRQAQGLARRGTWLWRDLERRVVDAYRASGDLPALVSHYEAEWRSPGVEQVLILAGLYEELGRSDDALQLLEQGVARHGRDVDVRLALIALLERRGQWQDALPHYRELLRLSDETIHRVQLAEALRRTGDESAALDVLAEAETRYRDNAGALLQLAQVYVRWGHRDRAIVLHERLVELDPGNPDTLIELGELYFMDGRRDEAIETWRQLLDLAGADDGESLALLGEVYAAHGLMDESIGILEQALETDPDSLAIVRTLAETLEEAHRYTQALTYWQRLADTAPDSTLRAEARSEIVAIYRRRGVLADHIPGLEAAWESTDAGPEAGYLLAEALIASGALGGAELVFLELLERDPDDLDALIPLAGIYRRQNRLAEAIDALRRAAELDQDRARDTTDEIAQLALRLFDDDLAIQYANRSIELDPGDAQAYATLGAIYRRSNQLERAMQAYSEAVRLDRRANRFVFDLAEIHVAMDRPEEAAALYREVVASGRDQSVILRAGRRAIQRHRIRGDLEALLAEWAPLTNRVGYERVSRRLVLELLEEIVAALAAETVVAAPEAGAEALERLRAAGRQASRALLAAVIDVEGGLAPDALGLLADTHYDHAAPALVAALSSPDPAIRRHGALAAGLLSEPATLESLLAAGTDEDRDFRALRAWALGELGDARAVPPLMTSLGTDSAAEVRAVAAVALGRLGDLRALPPLLAAAEDESALVRRGAIWGLGALGDPQARDALQRGLMDRDRDVRRTAALSLIGIPAEAGTITALLNAFWIDEHPVRVSAAHALRRLGGESGRLLEDARSPAVASQVFDRATDELTVTRYLDALLPTSIVDLPPTEARVLERYPEDVAQVTLAALSHDDEAVVARVLEDLNDGGDRVGLGVLTWDLSPDARRRAGPSLEAIERAVSDRLVTLARGEPSRLQYLSSRLLDAIRPGWR